MIRVAKPGAWMFGLMFFLRIIFGRQRGQTREFLLAIRGTQAAFAVILAEEIYA